MHSFFGAHLACSARSVSAVVCPAGFKTTRPCRRDVHLLVIRYNSWFIVRESSHWPNEAISSVKENETAAVMHISRIFWDGGVLMECAVKVKSFTSENTGHKVILGFI